MIIARSLSEIPHNQKSVVTVGTFDGVHLGHQQIVKRLKEHAQRRSSRNVVITFHPHPREVVGRGPVKLLTTVDERVTLLERLGIDVLLIVDFTYEFSRQTPREFYEHHIVHGIGVEEVIVGHDHMFGRDREAGVEELKTLASEFGFFVHEEPPFLLEGDVVSSSKIRELLLRGEVHKVNGRLGYRYTLTGQVIRGDGRGVTLGFPTANVQLYDEKKLIPAEGVYFVEVVYATKKYFGMLNIGVNPTFKVNGNRTVEVNIFDFQEQIYGKSVNISFIERLRGEQKFSTTDKLILQMRHDQEQCMKFIETLEQNTLDGERNNHVSR